MNMRLSVWNIFDGFLAAASSRRLLDWCTCHIFSLLAGLLRENAPCPNWNQDAGFQDQVIT
jgi:hypothetical protein